MVSRRQLRSVGITWSAERHRVRSGRLFEIYPGVFSVTPEPTMDGRFAAALLWADGTLGHESVLAAHALTPPRDVTHVVVRTRSRPAPGGVVLHRTRSLPARDRRPIRGLPATTVARALLDVAARTPPQRLRALVHEAQYRRLIDPRTLDGILVTHPGHPGLRALAAIDPAPRGTESGLERRLARVLHGIPGATRQFWLTLPSGRRVRADVAFTVERVLVEADGRDAHARMLGFESDRERDNETLALGWLPLRYTGRRMRRDPGGVRAEVLAVLAARGR